MFDDDYNYDYTQPPARFYSPAEVAERIGVSPVTVRRMIADGRFAAKRTGTAKQSRLLIPESELRRMLHEAYRTRELRLAARSGRLDLRHEGGKVTEH